MNSHTNEKINQVSEKNTRHRYRQAHTLCMHHVNRFKELDDNLQTKNDQKDALVIARLMRDGRFSNPRILKGGEAELRNGTILRTKLQEVLQNGMIRWLDRFFPEFTQVFKNFGKIAYAALKRHYCRWIFKGKR